MLVLGLVIEQFSVLIKPSFDFIKALSFQENTICSCH